MNSPKLGSSTLSIFRRRFGAELLVKGVLQQIENRLTDAPLKSSSKWRENRYQWMSDVGESVSGVVLERSKWAHEVRKARSWLSLYKCFKDLIAQLDVEGVDVKQDDDDDRIPSPIEIVKGLLKLERHLKPYAYDYDYGASSELGPDELRSSSTKSTGSSTSGGSYPNNGVVQVQVVDSQDNVLEAATADYAPSSSAAAGGGGEERESTIRSRKSSFLSTTSEPTDSADEDIPIALHDTTETETSNGNTFHKGDLVSISGVGVGVGVVMGISLLGKMNVKFADGKTSTININTPHCGGGMCRWLGSSHMWMGVELSVRGFTGVIEKWCKKDNQEYFLACFSDTYAVMSEDVVMDINLGESDSTAANPVNLIPFSKFPELTIALGLGLGTKSAPKPEVASKAPTRNKPKAASKPQRQPSPRLSQHQLYKTQTRERKGLRRRPGYNSRSHAYSNNSSSSGYRSGSGVSRTKQRDKKPRCVICLEDLDSSEVGKEKTQLVGCEHEFHTDCLAAMIQKQECNDFTCPTCRKSFTHIMFIQNHEGSVSANKSSSKGNAYGDTRSHNAGRYPSRRRQTDARMLRDRATTWFPTGRTRK